MNNTLTELIINNATYIIIASIVGYVIMRIFVCASQADAIQTIMDRYDESLRKGK